MNAILVCWQFGYPAVRSAILWNCTSAVVLWSIWLERNWRTFQNQMATASDIALRSLLMVIGYFSRNWLLKNL